MSKMYLSLLLFIACNNTSSFRCSSDSQCITTAQLCNNIKDCLHGEDEHDAICEHFCEWPSLNTCIINLIVSLRKILDFVLI